MSVDQLLPGTRSHPCRGHTGHSPPLRSAPNAYFGDDELHGPRQTSLSFDPARRGLPQTSAWVLLRPVTFAGLAQTGQQPYPSTAAKTLPTASDTASNPSGLRL